MGFSNRAEETNLNNDKQQSEIQASSSGESISRTERQVSTSAIPETYDINVDAEVPRNNSNSGVLQDANKKIILEANYHILFGEKGLEILENPSSPETAQEVQNYGALNYGEVLGALEQNGLIQVNEDSVEPTETGANFHNNWSGFQDYLSSKERIEAVEQELEELTKTDRRLTDFINYTTDRQNCTPREVMLDREREKRNWVRGHDSAELYEVTAVLYSDDEQVFDSLDALEAAKRSSGLEQDEFDELMEAGPRGLVDTSGLNSTGEKLYSHVLRDYMNI